MHKELFTEIEIPEGIEINLDGAEVTVKGPEGELKKEFEFGMVKVKKEGNKIILGNKKSTKREKKIMNTLTAHIKNMIKGVSKKFEYVLKAVFHHFPITIEVSGNFATIKNFLGEKVPRKVKIPEGVEIKVNKETIIITGLDKEITGQAAANFEAATRITSKDRRVFQDGIFIINKAGREM
jgi:large subunit ribosomal protein L6